MKKISESTFIIASNGFADGPAQALRDYLIEHKAKQVITISHPLVAEGDRKHIIKSYAGNKVSTKTIRAPHKPPYTYPLDLLIPFRLPKATAWFGFNNLAAYRGLMLRKKRKTEYVYYWAVDFVKDRFGKNPATLMYNKLDKKVVSSVNGRVELSDAGVSGRNKYLGVKKADIAPTQVVPMGSWLKRTPKVSSRAWRKSKIVYLGHLVERQGVKNLIEAARILNENGAKFSLEIVGSGPLINELKELVKEYGLTKNVLFHGFVQDHHDVEKILASASIATAPYRKEGNFVQFTDAGKLKAYLGAGLPIVLTDVPSNAKTLENRGAAILAEDDPADLAAKIKLLLDSESKWQKAHSASMDYAKEFDWDILLKKALHYFGFED